MKCKHEGCTNDAEPDADECFDCWRNKCRCGSGEYHEEAYDARGIYLCKVCDKCREEKLGGYRPEVLTDPGYEADEDIEPDVPYSMGDFGPGPISNAETRRGVASGRMEVFGTPGSPIAQIPTGKDVFTKVQVVEILRDISTGMFSDASKGVVMDSMNQFTRAAITRAIANWLELQD